MFKLMFSIFHLFFSNVCCKYAYLDVTYVFTHMMQVFYLDIAYVTMVSGVFASVSDACYFQMFVAIIASACFKTRSGVASRSSSSSVSPQCQVREASAGGGGPHWHGVGPTCLRPGATGEMRAGRRGTEACSGTSAGLHPDVRSLATPYH
jgi:hypothetical protein